jgi:integrase
MPRRKKGQPPSYRLHKQSGQAIVSLPLGGNKYRDVLLGPYDSEQSKQEYARVLLELSSAGGLASPAKTGEHFRDISVTEMCLRFWKHAKRHYRRVDGSLSEELHNFRYSLAPLVNVYGHAAATQFGPLALKALRQQMIDSGKLCRRTINHRIEHIKRLFKWATSEELVPTSSYEGMRTVAGLRKGHAGTFDHPKVKPVPQEMIDAVLPFLPPQVAAMVRLQALLGTRPGEICRIRGRDIDRSGSVWWYRIDPNDISEDGTIPIHKTANAGSANSDSVTKRYPIGPKAQAILRGWLRSDETEYLFQPREARQLVYAQRKERRKTPMTPSQRARTPKPNPKRAPRTSYDRQSYARVIRRACDNAGISKWHPHRLRHTCSTNVRKGFGIEAAQIYLGQEQLSTAEIYAERDIELIAQIAEKIG